MQAPDPPLFGHSLSVIVVGEIKTYQNPETRWHSKGNKRNKDRKKHICLNESADQTRKRPDFTRKKLLQMDDSCRAALVPSGQPKATVGSTSDVVHGSMGPWHRMFFPLPFHHRTLVHWGSLGSLATPKGIKMSWSDTRPHVCRVGNTTRNTILQGAAENAEPFCGGFLGTGLNISGDSFRIGR
jgi:hypothetical protein